MPLRLQAVDTEAILSLPRDSQQLAKWEETIYGQKTSASMTLAPHGRAGWCRALADACPSGRVHPGEDLADLFVGQPHREVALQIGVTRDVDADD